MQNIYFTLITPESVWCDCRNRTIVCYTGEQRWLKLDFPDAALVDNLHFELSRSDDQALRNLVYAPPQGRQSFLQCGLWIVVPKAHL